MPITSSAPFSTAPVFMETRKARKPRALCGREQGASKFMNEKAFFDAVDRIGTIALKMERPACFTG